MKTHQSTQLILERHAAGLTQTQVARHLGLESAQYVSNAERGLCRIAPAHFKKLAELYGQAAVYRIIKATLRDDAKLYNDALREKA